MAGCITDSRTKVSIEITNLSDGGAVVDITDRVDTPCLELLDQDYLQPWTWADSLIWATSDKGAMYVRTT